MFLGVWCALIGVKYPCGDCGKQVCWNQQAVQCDACQEWLHTKCLNISPSDYSILQQSDDPWICPSCYALPSHLQTAQPSLLHQEVTLVFRVLLESLLLHLHLAFVSTIAIVAVCYLRWMMLELLWPWVGLTS